MEFWIVKLAGMLLLPPLSLLLLALVGLLLARRWRRGGFCISAVAVMALWLLSTPIISGWLLASVESSDPPSIDVLRQAQAIVVLGGGTYFAAPEYGRDTTDTVTLERARWAARLHRETGLPVLASGGRPLGSATSEATQMKEALEQDLRVPVRWLEERSNNTLEAARYAHDILSREGIARIALVTHASHMRRARRAFIRAGFEVLDAPTAFSTSGPLTVLSFLPNAHGMLQTRLFCHEVLGSGWYHARSMLAGND